MRDAGTTQRPMVTTAVFACAWADIEVEGRAAPPPEALRVDATWRWQGALWQLDTPPGPLRLEGAAGRAHLHRVMARRAARLAWWSPNRRGPPAVAERGTGPGTEPGTGPLPEPDPALDPGPASVLDLASDTFVFLPKAPGVPPFLPPVSPPGLTAAPPDLPVSDLPASDDPVPETPPEEGPASLLREAFVVTDGVETWPVSLVAAAGAGGSDTPALALFDGAVPPRDTALRILSSRLGTGRAAPRGGLGIAAGTLVETPRGPVPVEALQPGQAVITDIGPCAIRRIRRRRAARTLQIPPGFFGAAGPEQPITVGRDARIGLEGPALEALFSLDEALVRAGDLETQPGMRLTGPQRLFTLGLGRPCLIMAGGLPLLCGQPMNSELRQLTCGEAQIALAGPPGRVKPRLAFRGAA